VPRREKRDLAAGLVVNAPIRSDDVRHLRRSNANASFHSSRESPAHAFHHRFAQCRVDGSGVTPSEPFGVTNGRVRQAAEGRETVTN
jgi:hypothetical protein